MSLRCRTDGVESCLADIGSSLGIMILDGGSPCGSGLTLAGFEFRSGRRDLGPPPRRAPPPQVGPLLPGPEVLTWPTELLTIGDKRVIHVENGRGEELRQRLASHGVTSEVSRVAGAPFDRLALEGDVDTEIVQTVLDQWER